MNDYQLPYTITSVLCPDGDLSAFFEEALAIINKPKAVANWITNDLLRELSEAGENGSLPLSESAAKASAHSGFSKIM